MSSTKLFCTWRRFIHSGVIRSYCNKFEWIKPSGKDTNIVVYNPITKDKTPLILKNGNIATWYMCGPTVYDSAHMGHACTYVKFDIIRRILTEFFDINVVLVMGLTDIDDKIIKRSNESGKNWQSLTEYYENEFFSDMDSLNVLRPCLTCKVTKYIPEIIAFIQKIVDKKGAYIGNDGSVYFDTAVYENYGKLNVIPEAESHPNKKSSNDFVLWKAAKENEPFWESPWGRGRPGWHIECSAIASTVFGNNIDIHSGGIDLAFPHHENEEAQSCCYHNNDQWINYWLHTGHLISRDKSKMSKSLKNTISISELLKSQTANQFRMLCLLTHYKTHIELSDELIKAANSAVKKIEFFISDCNDYVSGRSTSGNVNAVELLSFLEETRNKINAELADDFNTPVVVHTLIKLIFFCSDMLQQKKSATTARNIDSVAAVSNYIQNLVAKFGITQSSTTKESQDLYKVVDILVDFRNEVRNIALSKDTRDVESLKACDNVRKSLSALGVAIRDKKEQASWTVRSS